MRLAARLIAAVVPEPDAEYLIGDLEEQYARNVTSQGRLRATSRCWAQALRTAWHARPRRSISGVPSRSIDMSRLMHDLRLGVRTALKSPGYSAVTILTLALAIGANTLLFSIANPLLVRSLPLGEPERLGWVNVMNAERQIERARASMQDFLEWRDSMKSFSSLAAYEGRDETLVGHGDARRVRTSRMTANLLTVWGQQPQLGRFLQPGEDAPGAPLAGVLSDRFWRAGFNADPGALGRTLMLDGKPITIVGVMRPEIELGSLALVDIWAPLPLDPSLPRDRRTLRVVGMLAPGATVAAADAELQPIVATQARDHARTNQGWTAHVVTTRESIAANDTWVILGLLGVVVLFVLLIACANLANLVLARLVSRGQELAVRAALGASRWQLVRPLIAESLLLSLIGGAGGVAIANAGLKAINALASDPFMKSVSIDQNVLIFAALISVTTPLLFALWPALSAGRTATSDALRGTRVSGGRLSSRKRNVLVGGQVALALSLLIVSSLAVQSMLFLRRTDVGMDITKVLSFRLQLPEDRYPDEASHARFSEQASAALRAIPGAETAALSSHIPVIDGDAAKKLSGTPKGEAGNEREQPWASWFAVSDGFFETTGIPVIAGRTIHPDDRAGRQTVAVIDRIAAEKYFDSVADAVGRTITIHDDRTGDRPVTIVGVVRGTKDAQFLRSSPQIFVPLAQWPMRDLSLYLRSDDPLARAPQVQAAMRQLDPLVAISVPMTLRAIVDEDMSSSAIINSLFVSFALLALALAAGGLYGVVSYSVGQRRREFGIRLALGATPASVGRMVVAEGLRVSAVGVVIGLVIAVGLARMAASILFGIRPTDPATFAGVTLVVFAVAVFAAWSPSLRARRVDPAGALRAD